MADQTVGGLLVEIGADISDLTKEAGEAENRLKQLATVVRDLNLQDAQVGGGAADVARGLAESADEAGVAVGLLGRIAGPTLVGIATAFGTAGIAAERTLRIIEAQTGATGASLDNLYASARALQGDVAESADDVARAFSEIVRELDLVPEAAQTTTRAVIDLANVTGTALAPAVELSARVLKSFNVAAEDQADTLAFLLRVTQETGISYEQLAAGLASGGATLRELGFSAKESAAFLGQLHDAGASLPPVLAALRTSLRQAAEAGEDPKQVFRDVVASIRDAASPADAAAIAFGAFGERAEVLADALRRGDGDLASFVSRLDDTKQSLDEAGRNAETFTGSLTRLGNAIAVALGRSALGDFTKDVINLGTEAVQATPKLLGLTVALSTGDSGAIKQALQDLGLLTDEEARLAQVRADAVRAGDAEFKALLDGLQQSRTEAEALEQGLVKLVPATQNAGQAFDAYVTGATKQIRDAKEAVADLTREIQDQALLQGQSFDRAKANLAGFDDAFNRLRDAGVPAFLALAQAEQQFGASREQLEAVVELNEQLTKLGETASELSGLADEPLRFQVEEAEARAKLESLKRLRDSVTGEARIKIDADIRTVEANLTRAAELTKELEVRRSINVALDDRRARESLQTLESDISAFSSGRLPAVRIEADISRAQAGIQQLQRDLAEAKTDAERDAIQVRIDADTAKLDELKRKFQEVEGAAKAVGTSLEQAMTRAIESAQQARVELANAFGDAMAGHFEGNFAGDTPNIDVSGPAAATGAELKAQAEDFARDVKDAVESADVESLRKQQAALRDFLDNYQDGLTLIGDAAAKNAVGVFRTLEAEIGRLLQGMPALSGPTALQSIVATPSIGAAGGFDDDRIVTRLAEQNSLTRETNDRLAEQARATGGIASALASGNYSADLARNQQRASFFGGSSR